MKLAASALLLPHWGGLARCAAGIVCLALAAGRRVSAPSRPVLVPLAGRRRLVDPRDLGCLARLGVARPELDVVQLVVRWGRREKELAPVSIGASVIQFLLSIVTIPAVKLLPPSVLYRPELGPSLDALLVAVAVSGVLAGRSSRCSGPAASSHRRAEQQREAERHA